MRQHMISRFTELGDPTLLLLAGLAMFFYLWTDDRRRPLAQGWAVAFGLCVALTLAGKFIFYLIGDGDRNSTAFQNPSGHVAIATGFYGCCALLLARGRPQSTRALITVGAAMLVGLLAASRIALGLHTLPEIAAGFAVGAVGLAVFGLHVSRGRQVAINASQVAALLLLIGVTHYSLDPGKR
jgi:membrane-associated phospholipid phosphatase